MLLLHASRQRPCPNSHLATPLSRHLLTSSATHLGREQQRRHGLDVLSMRNGCEVTDFRPNGYECAYDLLPSTTTHCRRLRHRSCQGWRSTGRSKLITSGKVTRSWPLRMPLRRHSEAKTLDAQLPATTLPPKPSVHQRTDITGPAAERIKRPRAWEGKQIPRPSAVGRLVNPFFARHSSFSPRTAQPSVETSLGSCHRRTEDVGLLLGWYLSATCQ